MTAKGKFPIYRDLLKNQKNAVLDESDTFAISFRNGGVSIYIKRADIYNLVLNVPDEAVLKLREERIFRKSKALLDVVLEENGKCEIGGVMWAVDCGISQADIKPIRYEDGIPMIEGGRIFLTLSSRCEVNMYQSVFLWCPTTCDFRMEDAIFFDAGDGLWCSDVASSIIYDRSAGIYRIWMCAFSHGHVLGYGTNRADPRFGINVIDVKLMEKNPDAPNDAFVGKEDDEDPDFVPSEGVWHMAICRIDQEHKYSYYHFISDRPEEGYTFVDKTPAADETGGIFIPTDEGIVFACGSSFSERANTSKYFELLVSNSTPAKSLTLS